MFQWQTVDMSLKAINSPSISPPLIPATYLLKKSGHALAGMLSG